MTLRENIELGAHHRNDKKEIAEDMAQVFECFPRLFERQSQFAGTAKVGRTDAAVLTAVNITDELFKEREAGDALRRQVKQYLDEASQAKNEVSELKREIFKLQQQKK